MKQHALVRLIQGSKEAPDVLVLLVFPPAHNYNELSRHQKLRTLLDSNDSDYLSKSNQALEVSDSRDFT